MKLWHPYTQAALDPDPIRIERGDGPFLGDIGVIELKATDPGYFLSIRNRLYSFFIDRGVLLRPLGNFIYVMPPYVIAPQDLHYIYDVATDALNQFAQ